METLIPGFWEHEIIKAILPHPQNKEKRAQNHVA
jgi:hypothetical protein